MTRKERKIKVYLEQAELQLQWLEDIESKCKEGKSNNQAIEEVANKLSKTIAKEPQRKEFYVEAWKNLFARIRGIIKEVNEEQNKDATPA